MNLNANLSIKLQDVISKIEAKKCNFLSNPNIPLKEPASWFAHLEKLRLQSVSIFSIVNHPCSFTVYCYLLAVFSILVKYHFQVFFNSKVVLYVATREMSEISRHNRCNRLPDWFSA